MNQSLQEAARRHIGREVQRRALAHLATAAAEAQGAGATLPRPESVDRWRELPETWPEDSSASAGDAQRYAAAWQRCQAAAGALERAEQHHAQVERLSSALQVVKEACAPERVAELVSELTEAQATGERHEPSVPRAAKRAWGRCHSAASTDVLPALAVDAVAKALASDKGRDALRQRIAENSKLSGQRWRHGLHFSDAPLVPCSTSQLETISTAELPPKKVKASAMLDSAE